MLCDINNDEYIGLIKEPHTDSKYLDDELPKEDLLKAFDEIKNKYNLKNLTEKEMVEIYVELRYRCQISKTKISQLLNIERRKFSKILSKYSIDN